MDKQQLYEDQLMQEIIDLALKEDHAHDDITTNSLLEYDNKVLADVIAKESGFISGVRPFIATFKTVDADVSVRVLKGDGCEVQKGDVALEIEGMESSILKAERTALNFLQRLSGIATLTRAFVAKLKPYHTTLLDTRKTTPGMR
ncbi:MAG: nicotinate-nucleotide diphosphorylase (carboxylating), partial [Desulfobacteraceae bacterium]